MRLKSKMLLILTKTHLILFTETKQCIKSMILILPIGILTKMLMILNQNILLIHNMLKKHLHRAILLNPIFLL